MALKRNPTITDPDAMSTQAPWSTQKSLQRRVKVVAHKKGITASTFVQNVLKEAVEKEEARLTD